MARRDGSSPDAALLWQLLILSCLLAGLVAGCGSPITPEQKEAFAKIQAMGGRIDYRRGGYAVDLSNTVVADDDLAYLQKISNLKSLDLRDTTITDAGLEHLKSIDTLNFVGLPRSTVSAEAQESLQKSLPNTNVTR